MSTKKKNHVQLPPELAEYSFHTKLGYVALKAFFRICKDWNCTIDEQCKLLGGIGLIQLEKFRSESARELDRKTLIRIRCFVMIYKSLVYKNGSISKANREIRIPLSGSVFVGKSPLNHILRNDMIGLMEVCKYFAGKLPDQIPVEAA
jgi:hypothetical protein